MPWVWNQIFTAVNAMATAKNGAIPHQVPPCPGRSHQAIPNRNTGNTATDALLSIANTNAARLSQYQRKQWEVDSGQWAVFWLIVFCLAAGGHHSENGRRESLTNFKYHKIDNSKNNIAIIFFRCEIQATDCTFTGCNANTMAARNAPGMDNFRKINPNQQGFDDVQDQGW